MNPQKPLLNQNITPCLNKISPTTHKSPYGAKKWQKWGVSAAVLFLIFLGGCGTLKKVPVESNTEVHVKDSTVIHLVDSIRITEATRYKDMGWLGDTLKIEGSRSRMWAYADTTREAVLGGLEEDKVEQRYKIIYKDRLAYKDSLVYKEVPVEVEKIKEVVPKWAKYLLFANIVVVFIVCAYFFLRSKFPNITIR